MALWTWEMTALELASAYSTIASMWDKKEITPILKIIDSKWNPIYIKERDQKVEKNAISPLTAYLITSILINTEARPPFWNKYLTIPWRVLAAKTWTSTKQYVKNWRKMIFPQNLWTIWYTPQYTTVAWAWNTNWKQLNNKWSGLEWAGSIMRDVMAEVHKWKKAEKWYRPNWIRDVMISTNSWKLPSKSTPEDAKKTSMFINPPTGIDDSYFSKEVDKLCNWKVTETTPEDAKIFIKWVRYHSLKPTYPNWEKPVLALSSFPKIKYNDKPCIRTERPSNMELWVSISNNWKLVQWANYVELAYRSTSPIIKLEIILDGKKVWEYELPWKTQWSYRGSFNVLSKLTWTNTILVKAIDNQFYSKTISKTVILWSKDIEPPKITLTNPKKWNISLKEWTWFNLRAQFFDISPIRIVNVYFNWKKIPSPINSRKIIVPISSEWLEVWEYNIKIEAIDMHFNNAVKNIKVNVIE
jgi:hypothetical protein